MKIAKLTSSVHVRCWHQQLSTFVSPWTSKLDKQALNVVPQRHLIQLLQRLSVFALNGDLDFLWIIYHESLQQINKTSLGSVLLNVTNCASEVAGWLVDYATPASRVEAWCYRLCNRWRVLRKSRSLQTHSFTRFTNQIFFSNLNWMCKENIWNLNGSSLWLLSIIDNNLRINKETLMNLLMNLYKVGCRRLFFIWTVQRWK